MIFSFLIFFFNFFLVLIQVFTFYILYFIFYVFKVILNLPFYFLIFLKNFIFLSLNFFKKILVNLFSRFFKFFSFFFLFYVREAGILLMVHFKTIFYNWNKFLKWADFYRILFKVVPNSLIFLKLFLKIEINSLILTNWSQFLETVWEKLGNLYEGRTLRAYRFRFIRKLIKFTMGIVLLIYPLGYFIKMGSFKFSRFLFSIFRFFEKKGILSTKNSLFFLKTIIWFKVFFVWKSLPFEILFTYGVSKKYPQFEDVQPDIKIVPSEIWDYALDRYCYFDEDRVLNKYYIFHMFRIPTRYLTSILGLFFILPYLFFKNFSTFISIIMLIIYIPTIFFWLHAPVTVLFFVWKLLFTFIYFVPVFLIFFVFVVIFIFYKLIYTTYKKQFYRNSLNFIKLRVFDFLIFPSFNKLSVIWNFLIFKVKKISYYKNNYLAKYLFSLNNLLKIDKLLEKLLLKFSNNTYINNNIIGYNSSYVFKRVRSYTLRFKNFQFIKNFLKSYNMHRLTPDQFKAFDKIALNNYYPVYYFEKLFYMVYSKAEQELETPYYWAFMRQAFSDNQHILPPRFHVYGFFNFLNFFWNYFSFLSNKSFINLNLSEVNEFTQLFNSSYGRIFSYLVNDFLSLTKTKKFFFYLTSTKSFLQISTLTSSTILYLLPQKHYDILIKFYWFYLEPPLVRLLFNYYLHINTFKSIKIYNVLHEHISYSWYTFIWSALTEFDKLINEAFYSSLKFERFYDINFEKARDKYEFFIFRLAKALLRRFLSPSIYTKLKQKPYLPYNVSETLKAHEHAAYLVNYKYKIIDQYLSMFFSNSFKFWNYFFQFMTDNVFEFLARFSELWQDVRSSYITSWAATHKNIIIIFTFVKCFTLIWLFLIILVIFGSLYLVKSIFIKIIYKLKKYA